MGLAMVLASPAAPRASEVVAGGPLALTLTGFAGVLAHGGDLAGQREDPDLADGLDFSTDTEVHVLARSRAETIGLDYRATIEFEADTDEVVQTDETWLCLRGGCGRSTPAASSSTATWRCPAASASRRRHLPRMPAALVAAHLAPKPEDRPAGMAMLLPALHLLIPSGPRMWPPLVDPTGPTQQAASAAWTASQLDRTGSVVAKA